MFAGRMTRRYKRLATAMVLPLALACSDSESTGPKTNALVGTWQVTSLEAMGIDMIQLGMSMKFTFTAANTYTLVINDDTFGLCDTGSSCTESGRYVFTATKVTMDPGTEDEVTFDYTIQGAKVTFTTVVDGTRLTMILERS